MNRTQLEQFAKWLFKSDVYSGIVAWYKYTLRRKWRYVVFAARRSYVLALIMERITGMPMESTNEELGGTVSFLTDSAFFLHCQELAEEYRRWRRFPKILLCDDIIIYGRNLNHIIEGMERELCRLLEGEFEPNKIREALSDATTVHVYARRWDRLLLKNAYCWNLHYKKEDSLCFIHQFSNDVAWLIMRSGIANACYVFTQGLSEQVIEGIKDRLKENGYIFTKYQKTTQLTKCQYVCSGDSVKAVLSLRLIKNGDTGEYRIAPFVFLPNLGQAETDRLCQEILDRLPEDCRQYRAKIEEWEKLKGKRAFGEIMTLLMSNAVLQAFNEKYEVQIDRADRDEELKKLARNYDQDGFRDAEVMLDSLLKGNIFKDLDELKDLLGRVISEEKRVLTVDTNKTADVSEERKNDIRRHMEDYFYKRACEDEESAFELVRNPNYITPKRSKRRARGCGFTLCELNEGYSWQETGYNMAYFLQAMDAGILALSSYAPNDVRVVGFSQFAKAGEQSLLIEPLRRYEYITMLAMMQFESGRRFNELEDEIREFGEAYPEEYPPECIEMLLKLTRKLKSMGHTPRDWDGNFMDKMDLNREDSMKFLKKQSAHHEKYMEFAKKKYRY